MSDLARSRRSLLEVNKLVEPLIRLCFGGDSEHLLPWKSIYFSVNVLSNIKVCEMAVNNKH